MTQFNFTFSQVGGCVRDREMNRLFGLNLKVKDIDFVAVAHGTGTAEEAFAALVADVERRADKVWEVRPQFFTVRARVFGEDTDVVMARKEWYDKKSRKPVRVEIGTLLEDLQRRDFRLNAMTVDADGNLFDPLNGLQDLKDGVLETPLDPAETMFQDPLRALRAWRFTVMKGFHVSDRLMDFFHDRHRGLLREMKLKVKMDRFHGEMNRAFAHDTVKALDELRRMFPKPLRDFMLTAGNTSHFELTNKKV